MKCVFPMTERYQVTVIIPVYNGSDYLRLALQRLHESPGWTEMIVVDDGSTDGSAEIARGLGATVLSTGGRCGPAVARNLGAAHASTNLLLFLDADVTAHPDTVRRVLENFHQEETLDALIGSYDHAPGQTDFLSKYRNLMHSFFHRTGRRGASTFWSGCGAVKREVFLKEGGFSTSYGRPAIEDIELGYRMRERGYRLLLDPEVQVKHLKEWTLVNMVKTDVFDRAIPWTELILQSGHMPNDLNLRIGQRLSVVLVFLMVALAAWGGLMHGSQFLWPIAVIAAAMVAYYWVDVLERKPTWWNLIATVAVMCLSGYWASRFGLSHLIPPMMFSYLLLFARKLTDNLGQVWRRATGLVMGLYFLVVLGYVGSHMPIAPLTWALSATALTVLVINRRFYLFLGSRWGYLHAFAAIPFHFLYYLYSGISFGVGLLKHTFRRMTGGSKASVL